VATDPVGKKSLGQHWLHDETALLAIAQAADVGPDDIILEIGSGTGTLTSQLLSLGPTVIALEYDPNLASSLLSRLQGQTLQDRLRVEEGDIRTYDLGKMPVGYKIVANIPYYLTAYLLRLLTDASNKPSVASLLVQKEVAERVAAEPGDMSFISIAVQFYYLASLGDVIPATLFTPPPKVDSQILILHMRSEPLYADVDASKFFRVVKAGFSGRRKTLLNTLSGGLQMSRPDTTLLLQKADVSPQARAQELSLDQWHRLYRALA
jgi:16S rRNA (adenine1518-N6/adenine1519-N6)-dimethyltransferase